MFKKLENIVYDILRQIYLLYKKYIIYSNSKYK